MLDDWDNFFQQMSPLRDFIKSMEPISDLLEEVGRSQAANFRSILDQFEPLRANLGLSNILAEQIADFSRSVSALSMEDLLPDWQSIDLPPVPVPEPLDMRARLAELHAEFHAEVEEAAQDEAHEEDEDDDDGPWPGMYL